jgi:hypothetical protein
MKLVLLAITIVAMSIFIAIMLIVAVEEPKNPWLSFVAGILSTLCCVRLFIILNQLV